MWTLCALLLFSNVSLAAPVVNIEQVAQVPGGSVASAPSLGIAIEIPKGLTGMVNGESLLIGKLGSQVSATVMSDAMSIEQAVQAGREGFVLGGITYRIQGEPQVSSDRMSASLTGQGLFGGQRPAKVHVRAASGGQAVVVLVSGAPPDGAKVDALFGALIPTLTLTAPKVAAPPSPAPGSSSSDWTAKVADWSFSQFSRGSASSDRITVSMCANGTVSSYYSGQAFTDVVGAYSREEVITAQNTGRNSGRWSIVGNVVTIRWDDGSVQQLSLSKNSEGHFLVNGDRWYRKKIECQ